MKDNPQLSNITEVIEPTEEAQDLVTLTNSVSSSSFFGIEEELDPITQAIRQEILQKQLHILKDYIAANLDVTVNYHDDQKFAEYLKNVNNRAIINQAFLNSKVKAELEKIEIAGYKKVHHNFADRFHTINWQDDDRQDNTKSQIVRNDSGDELATIKETTHKINTLVFLSDGTLKQINNYRTIDLPTELVNKSGPMHLSLAVKDENGRNIASDRAVYFTAHYDSQGKLSEISSPKPVRFNGEGDEAIGYIEHLGHVYSLPVTQGKYREMMLALEKNKGQEIDLSQNITTAQDRIVIANTVNSDLPVQQEKKQYHHDKQKLGLTPITKQSPELSKIKQQSAKMEKKADKLMAKLETTTQSLGKELNKIQALADNLLESDPYKEKLTIFVKLKLEEQEAIRTGNPLPKSKEKDEALSRTEATKQIDQGTNNNLANYCKTLTDRMKKKFIGSDSQLHGEKAEEKTSLVCNINPKPNANIILPPVQTPQVQSNKTQVHKR